jgi:hypothetical protein
MASAGVGISGEEEGAFEAGGPALVPPEEINLRARVRAAFR